MKQREGPELVLQAGSQIGGFGVHVREFAPVGFIDWARGHGVVRTRVHVMPPEHHATRNGRVALARRLPHLFAVDEVVGLFPEVNLSQIAVVPPVADDAVFARREAGEHARLHGARHGGEHRLEATHLPALGEGRDSR